jgi:pSer/pThr/pTyr-binding forkhead associated (FHA) protein
MKTGRLGDGMKLSQDLFLDSNIPVLKEDSSRTALLDAADIKPKKTAKKKSSDVSSDAMKISLYLPNRRKPIVICNTASITLGRTDRQRNAIPTVDLSEENALLLGVSRLHAKLLYIDGGFYLKDMGSTNGTWLNQKRLAPYEILPIESGDQIRLGSLNIAIE